MKELDESYNYPLFFEQMFDADRVFGSIDGIATLRYDVYYRNPDPLWHDKLIGDGEKVEWVRGGLGMYRG